MVPCIYRILLYQRLFTIHPEDEYLPVGGVKKYICYDTKMSYKSIFEFVFIVHFLYFGFTVHFFEFWIHCAPFACVAKFGAELP